MTESAPPKLTVGEVYRLGGWDQRYARVLALGSSGSYGVSITDGNGDQRDPETELWFHRDDAWVAASGVGGSYHRQGEIRFRVKDLEIHAGYRLDETADPPELSETKVGNMSVVCTPIYRGA